MLDLTTRLSESKIHGKEEIEKRLTATNARNKLYNQ